MLYLIGVYFALTSFSPVIIVSGVTSSPFSSSHPSKSYPSLLGSGGNSPIGSPYVTSLTIGSFPLLGSIVILNFSNSPIKSIFINFISILYSSLAIAPNGNNIIASTISTFPIFFLFLTIINIKPVSAIINITK